MKKKPEFNSEYLRNQIVTDLLKVNKEGNEIQRAAKLQESLAQYTATIEEELWEAWEIAQGLTFREEQSKLLDEQRILQDRLTAFNEHILHHYEECKLKSKEEKKSDSEEGVDCSI